MPINQIIMNCNCLQEIPKLVADGTRQFKNEIITKAKFNNFGLALKGSAMQVISFSPMEIEVEGYKRPQTYDIYHSYCPFCGVKVGKEQESEVLNDKPGSADA